MRRAGARIATVAGLAASLIAAGPGVALAHGIGGRADLPVPLSFFVVGAGVALVVSFVAVSTLWPVPRLQTALPRRELAARWAPALKSALRVVGLAALLLVVVDGVVAGDRSTLDIGPPLVWVYFWLVVPFVVAVAGNLWRWISPWRTIAGWVASGSGERTDLAARIGVWPAVAVFVAFTWLELVYPSSGSPTALAVAAIVYVVFIGAATRALGRETALGSCDAFEVYNGVLSRIAPLSWRRVRPEGPGAATALATAPPGLAYRGWLRGLATMRYRPGLAAFVIAMIGTVTYDGMSGTEWWNDVFRGSSRDEGFGTAALLATVLVLGGVYWAASWIAARIAGEDWTAPDVAATFAHTLVPIALAYAVAHYFTLVLFEGQLGLIAASDPFGLGWNLFGTADWTVSFFMSPEVTWYFQVAFIVAGHVLGVILAHDRALAEFGGTVAVRTQYAMLVLMVALTSLGLFILAG